MRRIDSDTTRMYSRTCVSLLFVPLIAGCAYHTTLRRAIDLPWPASINPISVQLAPSKTFPLESRRDEVVAELVAAEAPAERNQTALLCMPGNSWYVRAHKPRLGPAWIQSLGSLIVLGPYVRWWRVEVTSDDWPNPLVWYCRPFMCIDFWFDDDGLRYIYAFRARVCL